MENDSDGICQCKHVQDADEKQMRGVGKAYRILRGPLFHMHPGRVWRIARPVTNTKKTEQIVGVLLHYNPIERTHD